MGAFKLHRSTSAWHSDQNDRFKLSTGDTTVYAANKPNARNLATTESPRNLVWMYSAIADWPIGRVDLIAGP
jgi:hypothetical protein